MNSKRIAGLFVVSALALSACSLGTPRPNATQSKAAATSAPAAAQATAGDTMTETQPGNTEVVTGSTEITPTTELTLTNELTPTMELTPTGEMTQTDEMTPTVEIAPTGEVTPTTEMTPTIDITPTDGMTPTTPATVTVPGGEIPMLETDVKSLVTRVRLNIRSGPGVNYPVIGHLLARRSLNVTGISSDSKWYRVQCANTQDTNCWVSADARYVIARRPAK
jgi:uncharacterized protein YgiM (DUF1202 family)